MLQVLVLAAVLLFLSPFAARIWVHSSAQGRIYRNVKDVPESRVAVVLGAGLYQGKALSTILRYRVDKGIELYKAGKVEKLLMSGDNSVLEYDEPTRMMEYAVEHGVPRQDVAMDFGGRRTYDTVYRAKHIFGLDRIIIVSQEFHLDRAVFLCKAIGVDGYGVVAKMPNYPQAEVREYPACLNAVLDAYVRHPKLILGKREKI